MNSKKPIWDSGTLEPVYRSHSGERAMPSWIFPRPVSRASNHGELSGCRVCMSFV